MFSIESIIKDERLNISKMYSNNVYLNDKID